MALTASAKHALRLSLGQHSGTEVIRLLDFVSDKLPKDVPLSKEDSARDSEILDKVVADVTANAVKLDEVLTPAPADPVAPVQADPVPEIPAPEPPPTPPVQAPAAKAKKSPGFLAAAPEPAVDESAHLDAPA